MRQHLFAIGLAVVVAACGASPTQAPIGTAPERTPVPTAATLTAATPTAATLPRADSMKVTLGIYSGRPDPAWELTRLEGARLRELVEVLPVAIGVTPQGSLGYHGFSVWLATAGQGLAVVAYGGTVVVQDGAAVTYWRDDARAVEAYLLDTGRPFLTREEVAAVQTALAAHLR